MKYKFKVTSVESVNAFVTVQANCLKDARKKIEQLKEKGIISNCKNTSYDIEIDSNNITLVYTNVVGKDYLVPKVITNPLSCEVKDVGYEWIYSTIVGINYDGKFISKSADTFDRCRIEKFTGIKPPPVGTRFRDLSWDLNTSIPANYYERFKNVADGDYFYSETDKRKYDFNEVKWIDYILIKE